MGSGHYCPQGLLMIDNPRLRLQEVHIQAGRNADDGGLDNISRVAGDGTLAEA